MSIAGVKHAADPPSGFRQVQEVKRTTDKACFCAYYNWLLWLPKRQMVYVESGPKKGYWASRPALDSAKEWAMRHRQNGGTGGQGRNPGDDDLWQVWDELKGVT